MLTYPLCYRFSFCAVLWTEPRAQSTACALTMHYIAVLSCLCVQNHKDHWLDGRLSVPGPWIPELGGGHRTLIPPGTVADLYRNSSSVSLRLKLRIQGLALWVSACPYDIEYCQRQLLQTPSYLLLFLHSTLEAWDISVGHMPAF